MSGRRARALRKASGVPYQHPVKVPTPVEERASTKRAGERLLRRVLRSVDGNRSAAATMLSAGAERAEDES